MKNSLTAILIVLSIGLFSCQKEVKDIFASGGSSGNRLVKVVSKSGSDSSVLAFGYNGSNKLTSLNSVTVSGGTTSTFSMRAERNSQGIIQKVIIKNPDLYQQYGLDSVITVVGYQAGHYSTEVTTIDLGGITAADSISLTYDANGKVVREESFFVALGSADTMSKTEYTYSGNNIASIKTYSYDPSTSSYTLVENITYDQYDDKLSPMYIGNDAFVFGSPEFDSYNNPTKSSDWTLVAAQTYTTTYTYNAANKPVTATATVQPANTTVTGTYYYQ